MAWVQFANDWKLNASEKNYRKAIELDPKFAQAYHWLGINLSAQGKFEEAHAILQSALKLDPNNHVILFNSALPAAELGKFEMAEKKHPTRSNRCPQLLFELVCTLSNVPPAGQQG